MNATVLEALCCSFVVISNFNLTRGYVVLKNFVLVVCALFLLAGCENLKEFLKPESQAPQYQPPPVTKSPALSARLVEAEQVRDQLKNTLSRLNMAVLTATNVAEQGVAKNKTTDLTWCYELPQTLTASAYFYEFTNVVGAQYRGRCYELVTQNRAKLKKPK